MIYLSYNDTNTSQGEMELFKRIYKAKSRIEWLGFIGFLGFMGFLKSYQGEPQYMFFGFFGFFSYFFIGYISREIPDERMTYNYQRAKFAMLKFYSSILAILWIFAILNNNYFHIQYVPMKVIELIVALVFAFSLILNSVLVYYYDRVE